MLKKKLITGIFIALTIVSLQVGAVFAAPSQQTATPPATATPAPASGTVTAITFTTDSTGTKVVQVTMDVNGAPQTFDVSLTTAASLGLIETDSSGSPVLDSSGNPIVSTTAIGTQITLQSTDILSGGSTNTTPTNPVASIIADFFGLTSDQVMTMHDDNGFGVIAQACFMAKFLNTDCQNVLDFKNGKSGSLPDLPTNVTNWGQLKKYAFQQALTNGENNVSKSMNNLGAIVSGRNTKSSSNNGSSGSSLSNNSNTSSNDLPKSKGSGHGKGHGHGKGNPNSGNGD